ncbi:MAG: cytochrome P450 [Acetobacteraceae bacterium]|nr:cytochrome P450 [Acetobacteraceae bacterium]
MDRAAPFTPPHPQVPARELPLWAFLRAIRTNALTMWPERAYREDMLVRGFLGRTNVLANAPEAIHRVLVENHANYRRSRASIRILRPIAGQGLLLSEGDAWRHQRRTTAPALAPRVMPMLAQHIVAAAEPHMARLAAEARNGPVDLLAVVQVLTLDIAGHAMFSLEMAQFGPPMRRMLNEFATDLSRPHLFDMLLPAAVPTWRDFRRRRFHASWMRLIEAVINARRARSQPPVSAEAAPRDLFDLLHAARDPETGEGFDRAVLRDQVATLVLAGHETTAVTLFWCLTLLAQDPAEQARVAAEARTVAITPDNAFVVLPALVRTRAVVQEAMRLYPPAFAIAREAIGSDRLAGVDIRPGAVVIIAPWVLHRHTRLWTDPLAFDPDRFMPAAPAVPRFSYLPFGVGPRVCIGAQFALTEATLVLAMLLRRFAVALADTRPVLPAAVVTTQPDHAPAFRVRER